MAATPHAAAVSLANVRDAALTGAELAHDVQSTLAIPHGLWIPLVTPFHDDAIDLAAMQALAHGMASEDIAGVVLFGSTGEGHLLSLTERLHAADTVRNAAPHLPLMLGVGGIDTRQVAHDMRELDALAPHAWLIPPPCYLQPSAAGIHWHYATLGDASERPIVIYDVPGRTGVRMSAGSVEALCETTSCVAIKACDPAVRTALVARGRVPVFCGDDTAFLSHALAGGHGAISASAHARPDLFAAILRLVAHGRTSTAADLFDQVLPLIHQLFQEPNPAPLKALLAREGQIEDSLRRPMTSATHTLVRQLQACAETLPSRAHVQHLLEGTTPVRRLG